MSCSSLAARRQLEIIEDALKSRTLRGATHEADLGCGRRNQVAQTHRGKALAIRGTKSFQRIGLANHSPPNRPAGCEIVHGRPVGEFTREHYAGVASIVEEFRPALYPILGVDADHEPRLIVERGVLSVDSGLENKITADRKMTELRVVGYGTVKCYSPEIRPRLWPLNQPAFLT